jgi:hypothetical protein
MTRRSLLAGTFLSGLALAVPHRIMAAETPDRPRLSGPYLHDNLAIYLVHGASAAGAVPLTLQEALARGTIRVIETGNVNELQVENVGDDEVFIQSGEIVKGGQQDRVLMVSLMLSPRSGRVPIASFCVEQGRWAARGQEDVRQFRSAATALPSREAKLAMAAAAPGGSGRPVPQAAEISARQRAMWDSVALVQRRLSANVGEAVAAPQSATSLQLSLENEALRASQGTYLAALKTILDGKDDAVGYVAVVNGRISSADIYPSSGLFRKLWAKMLDASITEAIGERNRPAVAVPEADAVGDFLSRSEGQPVRDRRLPGDMRSATREDARAVVVETRRADGGFLHRNYIAK